MHALRHSFALLLAFALLCVTTLARTDGAPRGPAWLERHPDTSFRLLVWNVDRELFARTEGFQRVLRAIDADVLILDEMSPDVSAERIAAVLPAGDGAWHVAYGTGGGPHQRASIAARVPVQRVPQFDDLPYPRERFDEWLAVVPEAKRERARGALESGIAAVGGVIELDGRRVLVVGVDEQCCGHEKDSPEELRRRFESQVLRAAIDAAAAAQRIDAILVGGDFNTVSGDAPIRIVLDGATAQTSLAVADARHRGSDAIWTWDGRGTPFPSRRIDYALHSDRLVVLQTQVFDTEDLTPEEAARLQLERELSGALSPHRPVVVDFGWR